MHILQTCGSRSWGGLEMQSLKIATALARRGHTVSLLCPPNSGLTRHGKSAPCALIPILRGGRHYLHDIGRTTAFLRKFRPDVVHCQHSHDLWTLVPALCFAGLDPRFFLTKRMGSAVVKKDPLHRLLYYRLDAVFAISAIIHRDVLDTCPVPPGKVHTLINGVEIDRFQTRPALRQEARTSLGIAPHEVVIGMIARLTPGKGQREFLRAARILLDRCPLPLRFLMVGEVSLGEEAYAREIEELIATLGLGTHLIQTGFQEDVVPLYAAMDILAFPSHDESLGNVLLEAMAMRLPIVGSNSGSVPELVDPENGILVPPRDPETLASGLMRLAENPVLRQQMGRKGRQRVEERFHFERYLDRLEAIYTGVEKEGAFTG